MPGPHYETPLSIRLGAERRARVYALAAALGIPVRQLILAAIDEKLQQAAATEAS